MEVKEKVQVNAVAVEEAVRMKTDVQVALELDNGLERNRKHRYMDKQEHIERQRKVNNEMLDGISTSNDNDGCATDNSHRIRLGSSIEY